MSGVIKVNPSVFTDKRDAHAVVVNEALRLFMEDSGFVPKFNVTPEQLEFFKGTAYVGDGEGTAADAARGGDVLGKLNPGTWGGSGGRTSMRADTRTDAELYPKQALRSSVTAPTTDEIIGVRASGNPVVDTVNRIVGAATTFGPAGAALAKGAMGGVTRVAGASEGAPRVTYDADVTATGRPIHQGWRNDVGPKLGEPGVTKDTAKWAIRRGSTAELESLQREGYLLPLYAPGDKRGSKRQDKKMWALTNKDDVKEPAQGEVYFRAPARTLDLEKMAPAGILEVFEPKGAK